MESADAGTVFVNAASMVDIVKPMISVENVTPSMSPTCWRDGVAPRRNPVFRSCEVAPAFADPMQTTAPIERATAAYAPPVHPTARKIRQVAIRVAIVIPEIGFEDEPISPTSRDETVTKRKPKITIRIAAATLATKWPGFMKNWRMTQRKATIASDPPATIVIGMSRSVRCRATAVAEEPPRISWNDERSESTITGIARMTFRMPPIATAPAPMYRTYAPRSAPGAIWAIGTVPGKIFTPSAM